MRRMKPEAVSVLDDVLSDSPEVLPFYEDWKKTYRLNTVVCSAYLSKQFCRLEGNSFDEELGKRVYIASAAACVSDDLTDKSNQTDLAEVYLLDKRNHKDKPDNVEQQFFYALHSRFLHLIPSNFEVRFKNLIERYNQYQEMGRNLTTSIRPEEIVRIKNGTGGFPFLLLYAITFPETNDLPVDFEPVYSHQFLPDTKQKAIFNYGAMVSRLDDLDDLEYDSRENRKSLATEGLTNWREIRGDVECVRRGLERFYPRGRVDEAIGIYTPVSLLRFTSKIGNLLARIRKVK